MRLFRNKMKSLTDHQTHGCSWEVAGCHSAHSQWSSLGPLHLLDELEYPKKCCNLKRGEAYLLFCVWYRKETLFIWPSSCCDVVLLLLVYFFYLQKMALSLVSKFGCYIVIRNRIVFFIFFALSWFPILMSVSNDMETLHMCRAFAEVSVIMVNIGFFNRSGISLFCTEA